MGDCSEKIMQEGKLVEVEETLYLYLYYECVNNEGLICQDYGNSTFNIPSMSKAQEFDFLLQRFITPHQERDRLFQPGG